MPHGLASVHEVQRGAPIADGLAVGAGDCAVVKFRRIGKRRRHLKLVQRIILKMVGALRTMARRATVLDVRRGRLLPLFPNHHVRPRSLEWNHEL